MQTGAIDRPNSTAAQFRQALAAIVGQDNVRDDEASLRLHSEDVFEASDTVAMLIVAPTTVEQTSAVMKAARSAGVAIAPRGAGMS
jgi:D-lactate dehydrogenase (cytochrome)